MPSRPRGARLVARRLPAFVCGAVWLLCTTEPAAAGQAPQEASPAVQRPAVDDPTSAAIDPAATWLKRMDDLEQWLLAYERWRRWADQWFGRREPGWFTGSRERRPKPDPPAWLPGLCADLAETSGLLFDACQVLADWRDHDPAHPRPLPGTQIVAEDPRRTSWWEHLHLDAFWPVTRSQASAYGVAGVHASVAFAGRMHVFAVPGVMFLSLPGSNGREWTAAAHWGLGWELADFTLPGAGRPATLHVNVARAWLLGNRPDTFGSSLTIAGFSLTFKKAP
jgi:hypothetical protein